MNDNYEFQGFPDLNGEFEKEDNKNASKSEFEAKILRFKMPPEIVDMLKNMGFPESGSLSINDEDIDKLLNSHSSIFGPFFEMLMNGISGLGQTISETIETVKENSNGEASYCETLSDLTENPFLQNPIPVRGKNIENNFFQVYGENNKYSASELLNENMVVINSSDENAEMEIISESVREFELLFSNEKYMLFKAITKDNFHNFIVAVSQENKSQGEYFLMYIPRFGNNVLITEDGLELNDANNISVKASKLENIEKIKTECDLVLAEEIDALTTVEDFGRVLHSKKIHNGYSDTIFIGTITSNGSFKANQFIKAYNLDEDAKNYNFYVKLSETHSADTLNKIADFLMGIDFNENLIIQEADIFKHHDGIGIKLNLDVLESNIDQWE